MKGLVSSIFIIFLLIAIGIGTSIMVTSDLNNKMAAASERGFEVGLSRGYEMGFKKGGEAGYQEGGKTGYARSGNEHSSNSSETGFYLVYNPTYDEAREILTEKEEASAWEIHDYAEASGIRTAYVRVQIARKAETGRVWVYRLVAFETIDQGFVIIEPWSQKTVTVEVGQPFRAMNGFSAPSYNDTVTKVTIIW